MDPAPPYLDYLPPAQNLSVTDPLSKAFARTKMMLFPMRAAIWFTLGFVAWLAHLGEGGGGSFNIPDTSGRGRGGGSGLKPAVDWVLDNLSLVLIIVIAAIVIGGTLALVMLWVSSRAKFMFIDCIVKNEAKVEEPWRRFAERGKDLFWVRLWLSVAGFALLAIALSVGVLLAWADIKSGVFGTGAILGLVVGFAILLILAIPLGIASFLLEDFVVPAMYLNDESAGPAWRRVKSGILAGNLGTIVLYWLMKLAVGFAVGMISAIGTCLTCCLAALPYLGTVIFLPLFVFTRSYALYFVNQFGPEWRLFPEEPLGVP